MFIFNKGNKRMPMATFWAPQNVFLISSLKYEIPELKNLSSKYSEIYGWVTFQWEDICLCLQKKKPLQQVESAFPITYVLSKIMNNKSEILLAISSPTANFLPQTSRQVNLPDILILAFLIRRMGHLETGSWVAPQSPGECIWWTKTGIILRF